MPRVLRFIPAAASFVAGAGLELSGVEIPALGFALMGLSGVLLSIAAWPYIRRIRIQYESGQSSDETADEDRRYSREDIRFFREDTLLILQTLLPLTRVGESSHPLPVRTGRGEAADSWTTQQVPIASGGAVTRAGGNTTEVGTTSTTLVDLMSVSGLNLKQITPFPIVARVQGNDPIRVGLKLNGILSVQEQEIAVDRDGALDIVWYAGAITSFNRQTVYMKSRGDRVTVDERPLGPITDVTIIGAAVSGTMVVAGYAQIYELPTV